MSAAKMLPVDVEDEERLEREAICEEGRGDPAVVLTRFDGHAKPDGRRFSTTWSAWFRDCEAASVRPHDGRGWSPATFARDHRSKATVEAVVALAYDLEPESKETTVDPLRLGDPHRAADAFAAFFGLVHTSRSHRTAAPRCRVVLPTSRPITAAEHAVLWPHVGELATRAGLRIDPATKDPSRFWYLASLPAEGDPVVVRLSGRVLPVDEQLEEARTAAAPPRDRPAPAADRRDDQEGPRRYARRALESAVGRLHMAPPGTRNDTLSREAYGVGQAFAAADLPLEEARQALRAAIAAWDPAYMAKHEDTLERQLAEGARVPRDIPDRREPPRQARGRKAPPKPPGEPDKPSELDHDDDERPDGRPVIKLCTALHRNVDEAIAALADEGNVYQREGDLVHVARLEEDEEPGRRRRIRAVAGTPRVYPVTPGNLADRLSRCAEWLGWNGEKKEWRQAFPSSRVIAGVLERKVWRRIPRLVALTETPVLRPDGSVHDRPGYDDETGFLFLPTTTFRPVPQRPTIDDARRALAELVEVFVDFPYAAPAHREVAIAAILTMLARPAIDGPTPAFLHDASMRGSGKSLHAHAVGMITTGRAASLASWPVLPEELEKVLASIALQANPLAVFDNVATPFGGAAIDKVLTCPDLVQFRVLGKTEAPSLPWRTVIMASGNNITFTGDTARRTLLARLEPDVERPEERTDFRHPNLLAWVRAERGRLAPAALTILRAWSLAGRPGMGLTWGSLEAWAALVPAALLWAGGANVLEARAVSQDVEEPEVAALRAILEGLRRLAPEGITTKDLVGRLYPPERLRPRFDAPPPPPDGFDDLRGALEVLAPAKLAEAPDVRKLGYQLRRFKGRPLGGLRLDVQQAHSGIAAWIVRGKP